MGSVLHSVGDFLGTNDPKDNPRLAGGQFGNSALDALNQYVTNNPDQQATGATTGSQFATDQVMGSPLLGGLYGQGGQLQQAEDKLTDLNKQGFQLTPEDKTMYGQMSGDIARQFGQQGNQVANDLASRGLSSSGAAGAAFSGLAGNQNEMLAHAQQQIAQQRFQNTMNQVGQYQNFVNSMGQGANSALNQQYGRQLAGAQEKRAGLGEAAGLQEQQNAQKNSYEQASKQFEQDNKPQNIFDMALGGVTSALGAGGKTMGQSAGAAGAKGLFGAAAL